MCFDHHAPAGSNNAVVSTKLYESEYRSRIMVVRVKVVDEQDV